MSEQRNPSIYIATGQQGVGKSYRTEIELAEYIQSHKNRPVIIFDVNNEYTSYKTINLDVTKTRAIKGKKNKTEPHPEAIMADVMKFCSAVATGKMKPQIRRILPYKKNGENMGNEEKVLVAGLLLKHAKGCLILLEDLNTYMMGARSVKVVGALLNKRHKNQDIIIHTQSLDRLDPFLFSQCEIIRFHHQPSSVSRIAYKLPSDPEMFEIGKKVVDLQYDQENYEHHQRFFVYFFPQESRMVIPTELFKGCKKSKEQIFREACEAYVSQNHKKALKPYMEKIDLKAGKVTKSHDIQSALEAFIQDKIKYVA